MESTKPDAAIAKDALHIPAQSKLSAEAIAKAVAHHNKQHGGSQPKDPAAKQGAGKKSGAQKAK